MREIELNKYKFKPALFAVIFGNAFSSLVSAVYEQYKLAYDELSAQSGVAKIQLDQTFR